MLRDEGRAPAAPEGEAESQGEAARERRVVCARCGHEVTRREHAVPVSGAHEHVFMNPYGHVFRVGCFREAAGAAAVTEASREWTWFPGYAWRVAVCARCGAHLGWWFEREGDRFAGLSLDAVTEA